MRMSGVDLTDIDLREANLEDATLENVIFNQANLSDAIFSGSVITSGEFFRANLQGAKFYSAELRGAFVHCANMSGAELGAAKLQGIIGGPSPLEVEHWLEHGPGKCNMGPYAMDLTRAVLRGADLSNGWLAFSNLTGADFGAAVLSETNLYGADISGARMELVQGLSQDQLDLACARPDSPPIVPNDVQWNGSRIANSQCKYLEAVPPAGADAGRPTYIQ
jgi:hypothetical protein